MTPLASLSNIGQLFGSVTMGFSMGAIGRKKTIMVFCLPLLVGWVIVGMSKGNVMYICIGRVFQGIGIMSSVTQTYLVEVADAERRYVNVGFLKRPIYLLIYIGAFSFEFRGKYLDLSIPILL